MATKTSKVLQKPEILSLVGSTIRIKHPDITRYTRTYITSPLSAAGTSLSVLDNNTIEDDDILLLGEIGDAKTETVQVNGAVTRGGSVTIENTTKFAHEISAPATKVYERGIKIYGASSDGGTGTLIASVDAITTPIADAVIIQWNKLYTEYTIQSSDTAYSYYFVKFTDGTTDSSASDYVASTGLAENTVQKICEKALERTNTKAGDSPDDLINWKLLISACNSAQDEITQWVDENGIQVNWPFEMVVNDTSITTTENENKYALSGLTYALKFPDSNQSILKNGVKFGSVILEFLPADEFEEEMEEKTRGELASDVSASDTSITLSDSYEFSESGVVYLGTDTITYTTNTETTGVLSGISSTDIESSHSAGDTVWQGVSPSTPEKYTIYDGNIYLDVPVESDEAGKKLKFKYWKALTALSETTDITEISFYNIMWMYVAAMIEYAKKNINAGNNWLDKFKKEVSQRAKGQKVYLAEQVEYYKFGSFHPLDANTIIGVSDNNND